MGRLHNNILILFNAWIILGVLSLAIIGLPVFARWAIIAIGLITVVVLDKRITPAHESAHWFNPPSLGVVGAVLLVLLAVPLLWSASTMESIRSPWWVLPWWWVLLPLGLTIIAIVLPHHRGFDRTVISGLTIFVVASVLAIVYGQGYGFDFHIHEQTLRIIDASGTITPLPPYYLGAYVVVILAHTLLPVVSIATILQWSVPLLATILLPTFFSNSARDQKLFFYPMVFTMIAGAWLAESTPQALALLWGLCTIWLLTVDTPRASRGLIVSSTLATIAIHPLTGIPIAAVVVMALLPKTRVRWWAGVIVSALLPIAFLAVVWRTNGPLDWVLPTIALTLPWVQEGNALRDILFTLFWNRWTLVALLALGLLRPKPWREYTPVGQVIVVGAVLTLLNAILFAGFSSVPNVIAYETTNFSARIAETALIILTPMLLFEVNRHLQHIVQKYSAITATGFLTIIFAMTGMNIYARYPIDVDGYHVDKGYSVSIHDIRAVETIARDAGSNPYIVLANQSVSAAALKQFGFAKYFAVNGQNDPMFYYPIPTGGPLYAFYLRFVYEDPSAKTVRDAMQLVGVDRAYVVINRYWRNSAQLMAKAQQDATWSESIDGGMIGVYRYDR